MGVRSGDTPSSERRALQKQPPDILITTPESLYLMLTASARETLDGVTTVIIDEVDPENWGVGGEPVTVIRQRRKGPTQA